MYSVPILIFLGAMRQLGFYLKWISTIWQLSGTRRP